MGIKVWSQGRIWLPPSLPPFPLASPPQPVVPLVCRWSATLECELPNSRIHQFTGVLHWNEQPNRQTPVDQVRGP